MLNSSCVVDPYLRCTVVSELDSSLFSLSCLHWGLLPYIKHLYRPVSLHWSIIFSYNHLNCIRKSWHTLDPKNSVLPFSRFSTHIEPQNYTVPATVSHIERVEVRLCLKGGGGVRKASKTSQHNTGGKRVCSTSKQPHSKAGVKKPGCLRGGGGCDKH